MTVTNLPALSEYWVIRELVLDHMMTIGFRRFGGSRPSGAMPLIFVSGTRRGRVAFNRCYR